MRLPSIITLLSLLTLLFPLTSIIWLWKGKDGRRLDRALRMLACSAIFLFSYLAGTWGLISYYLKFAFFILFAFSLALSIKKGPVFSKPAAFYAIALRLFAPAVFAVLDSLVISRARAGRAW